MLSATTRDEQLQWWKTVGNEADHETIDAAVNVGGRHSRVVLRRSLRPEMVRLLLVADRDRRAHTGTDSGRWLAAHAIAMFATRPPRSRWAPNAARVCYLIAVFSGATAAVAGADAGAGMRLGGAVTAALFTLGGVWLQREHRRCLTERLRAADRIATKATSVAAARAALSGDGLYKTAAHQWWEHRNPISPTNRLNRLDGGHPDEAG